MRHAAATFGCSKKPLGDAVIGNPIGLAIGRCAALQNTPAVAQRRAGRPDGHARRIALRGAHDAGFNVRRIVS
jgi:hypothetical protein